MIGFEEVIEHPEFEEQRQRAEQAEQKVEKLEAELEDKQGYIDDSTYSLEKEFILLHEISEEGLTISEAVKKIKKEKSIPYGMAREIGTTDVLINFLESLEMEERIVEEIVEVEVIPKETKEEIRGVIWVLEKLLK